MFKKRGQGQSWLLDIILAFVVFVLIIGIFYALLSNNKKDKTEDLTLDSNTVISNLDSSNGQISDLTIINQGSIDDIRLNTLYSSDYQDIKRQFGIRGDFCIYIIDQYGNLITINNGSEQIGSFGNGNFSINNKPCGSALN
jgi:hypothetical protein